ncbi:MAG: hypothetical protein ACRELD_03295 [Longimicrobiales bacterium]
MSVVRPTEMGFIRWFRISAALASLGHSVDIASNELWRRVGHRVTHLGPRLRIVPLSRVDWSEYDVVKTHYHEGFETFERHVPAGHRFVIAHLGSMVGPVEMEGIHFHGRQRERLYRTQERVRDASRYVSLLNEPARQLWRECFGERPETLVVPGAADAEIPPPGPDPYAKDGRLDCVFSGNYYTRSSRSQPEAHATLTGKLNRLGRLLWERGGRLHVVGPGDRRSLDARVITVHGAVRYERSWDYLYHAAVGVVLLAGRFQHNNESTKIYHYLRAGLPVVSEAGFPNDHVVTESGLGSVVENGAIERIADRVLEAGRTVWDRQRAVQYILDNHTWTRRAETYDALLRERAGRC